MLAFLDSILIFLGNILLFAHEIIFSRYEEGKKIWESELIPKIIKEYTPWVIIGIFVLSFIIGLILKSKNRYSKDVIKRILSDYHQEIFGLNPDHDTNSRITYFREASFFRNLILFIVNFGFFKRPSFFKMKLDWRKHLFIYCRTGKFQASKTVFQIEKDYEGKNRGIAGRAWYGQGSIAKEENLGNPNNDKSKRIYLKRANISEEIFSQINIKAQSIIGLAIQNIRGERSGVIVIDTKHSKFNNDIDDKITEMAKKLMYVV
jgi:hypothetical protein